MFIAGNVPSQIIYIL